MLTTRWPCVRQRHEFASRFVSAENGLFLDQALPAKVFVGLASCAMHRLDRQTAPSRERLSFGTGPCRSWLRFRSCEASTFGRDLDAERGVPGAREPAGSGVRSLRSTVGTRRLTAASPSNGRACAIRLRARLAFGSTRLRVVNAIRVRNVPTRHRYRLSRRKGGRPSGLPACN